jgi:hypothetical protein
MPRADICLPLHIGPPDTAADKPHKGRLLHPKSKFGLILQLSC